MVIHVFMSSWVTKTKVVLATDAMTASQGTRMKGVFIMLENIT